MAKVQELPTQPQAEASVVQAEVRLPRLLRSFGALGHRDYRYLFGGSVASQLGQWVQQMGRGWLVYDLTQSPFQLSLVGFFSAGAMLLFSPLGGAMADRFDRRRMMMVSQALMAAVALLTAILVATGTVQVWHLHATAFISGGLFAMNNPTRQALVYDVVGRKDLSNAIALNSMGMNSTRVLGPSIGGVLLLKTGVQGTFFVQAATLVIAFLTTTMVHPRQRTQTHNLSMRESIVTGVKYAKNDRTILLLLLMATVASILAWPYIQLMPAYAKEELNASETGFGLVMSAIGIGALVGSIYVALSSGGGSKGIVLMVAMVGNGIFLVLLGLSSHLALSMVILMGTGLTSAVQMATNQTLIQLNVKDEYRGRVTSLYFFAFGLQPVGMLPTGILAEAYGTRVTILVTGAILAVTVALFWLVAKRLRTL